MLEITCFYANYGDLVKHLLYSNTFKKKKNSKVNLMKTSEESSVQQWEVNKIAR